MGGRASRQREKPMDSLTDRPDFHLDILLYRETEGWAAHCLQLDLVEIAASENEAFEAIVDVVRAHIEYAIENDNMENVFSPAPADVWKRFFGATLVGRREVPLRIADDAFPLHSVSLQRVAALRSQPQA